jgi:hypothetical protein
MVCLGGLCWRFQGLSYLLSVVSIILENALHFSTADTSYLLAYEDGTDRMFRNVGI